MRQLMTKLACSLMLLAGTGCMAAPAGDAPPQQKAAAIRTCSSFFP